MKLKYLIKKHSNIHIPKGKNIFLFTMPRSGSTWLMELLMIQPKFKYCNEPLYLDNPIVKINSGLQNWSDLHSDSKLELIHSYFRKLNNGKFGFLNPNPVGKYYRFFTNRIIFKIIHGGEERINWFRDSFNGQIIYLIRHPIAVALSHKKITRLYSMLDSQYGDYFTENQKTFANKIIENGSEIEKVVLSWCLQNYVPLKMRTDDWIFLTYEQLVLEPKVVIQYLSQKLEIENIERILERVEVPSMVKRFSDEETNQIISGSDRKQLISKWRNKVSEEEEKTLFKIIDKFDLNIYNVGNDYPNSDYLI